MLTTLVGYQVSSALSHLGPLNLFPTLTSKVQATVAKLSLGRSVSLVVNGLLTLYKLGWKKGAGEQRTLGIVILELLNQCFKYCMINDHLVLANLVTRWVGRVSVIARTVVLIELRLFGP